jgi:hypothetical protein
LINKNKIRVDNMKRDTVGKISSDLLIKTPDSNDPIELELEMQKDYIKELLTTLSDSKNKFIGNFYIVVITKKERLMENVLRNYFFARQSCPTPDFDQSVYYFDRKKESLEYLWTVPSRDTIDILKENACEVDKSEWGLLKFVLQFCDGTLFKISKDRNGEAPNSPLLRC